LISELWLYPHSRLELKSYLRYDLNENELSRSDTSIRLKPWRRTQARVGLSTHDPGPGFDSQEELYVDLAFALSNKYTFAYRHRRDIDESETRENRFTLTRDMHDLEASFVVREKNYDDEEHEIEFKAFVVLKLPGSGVTRELYASAP